MRRPIKYRTLLILCILIPVAVVGLSVGAIGTIVHIKSLRRMVDHLGYETNSRIVAEISRFLRVPVLVNKMNADAIAAGRMRLDDPALMESLFISRVKYTPSVTSVYFGNDRGGLVDAGREGPDGEPYVIATEGFKAGVFRKYALREDGSRGDLLSSFPDFDARTRPWYEAALAAGKPTWTEPFLLFTGQDKCISAVHPVRSADGKVAGVLSVDIFLSQLERLLADLQEGLSGQCFITDYSGMAIVASEGAALPDALKAKALDEVFSGSWNLDSGGFEYGGVLTEGGVRYNVHARSIPADIGLEWCVFTAYPESVFASRLRVDLPAIAVGGFGVFLMVAAIAVSIASVLRKPIDELVALARDIPNGTWSREPGESSLFETEILRTSMLKMRDDLKYSFAELKREIEARDEANRRIERLLAEKEIILKEVHHRVKNNMNVVVSLLRIDESLAGDPKAAAILKDASARVQSMALLYDRLFMSDAFTEADFADYVRAIARELSTHYDPAGEVDVRWDTEPVVLPSRLLFPLGIIVNEALTNAYKYAFPEGRGTISIRLARDGERVELLVRDEGVGFGDDRDAAGQAAFGMKLIASLVEQIDGELRVDGSAGVAIGISFPAEGWA